MKKTLDELQELADFRLQCEKAVEQKGLYDLTKLCTSITYVDDGYDETKLAHELFTVKHRLACTKLRLINTRIKFLIKKLK